MRKNKRKSYNKYENKVLPSRLNLTRYTFESWMETYPKSNVEEWYLSQYPDDPIGYIDEVLTEMGANKFQTSQVEEVLLVTIGKEANEWAEQHPDKQGIYQNAEYANVMDEETATMLMKKYNMDTARHLMAIPILIFHPTGFTSAMNEVCMSKETHQHLEKYLTNWFETGVYVAPYYVRGQDLYEHPQDFDQMAKCYLDEHVRVKLDKYKRQIYQGQDINATMLYIPFVVQERFTTARFHVKNLYTDDNGMPIPKRVPESVAFFRDEEVWKTKKVLSRWNGIMCDNGLDVPPDFLEPLIQKWREEKLDQIGEMDKSLIQNDIPADMVEPSHVPLYIYDIPQYEKLMWTALENDWSFSG